MANIQSTNMHKVSINKFLQGRNMERIPLSCSVILWPIRKKGLTQVACWMMAKEKIHPWNNHPPTSSVFPEEGTLFLIFWQLKEWMKHNYNTMKKEETLFTTFWQLKEWMKHNYNTMKKRGNIVYYFLAIERVNEAQLQHN